MPLPVRPRFSRKWWRAHAVALHDTWNLAALGALNVAHVAWWSGAAATPEVLSRLFLADVTYIVLDVLWLVGLPECVGASVWSTLAAHHCTIACCSPIAFGRPVLMRHMLRCWLVEVSSWNHVAARKWESRLFEWINKPLYFATRFIGFPLSYFIYHSERAALSPAEVLAESPLRIHLPLSIAHWVLYGLMLHWGYKLLLRPAAPPPASDDPPAKLNGGAREGGDNGDNGDNGDDGLRHRRGVGAGEITDIQAAALASQALYASAVLGD